MYTDTTLRQDCLILIYIDKGGHVPVNDPGYKKSPTPQTTIGLQCGGCDRLHHVRVRTTPINPTVQVSRKIVPRDIIRKTEAFERVGETQFRTILASPARSIAPTRKVSVTSIAELQDETSLPAGVTFGRTTPGTDNRNQLGLIETDRTQRLSEIGQRVFAHDRSLCLHTSKHRGRDPLQIQSSKKTDEFITKWPICQY